MLFYRLQDERYEIRDRQGNLAGYAFLTADGFYHVTDPAGNFLFQIHHNYQASYDIYGPRGYFYNTIYCPFPGHSHYNPYYFNVGLPLYYGHVDFGQRYYRVDRHNHHQRDNRHRRGDNRGHERERGGRTASDAGSSDMRSGDFFTDTRAPEPRFRDGSGDRQDRNRVTDRQPEVTSGNDRVRGSANDRRGDDRRGGNERERRDFDAGVQISPTIPENDRGWRGEVTGQVDGARDRQRDIREISPDMREGSRDNREPRQARPENRRDNPQTTRDRRTDPPAAGQRGGRRGDVDSGRGRQRHNREISPDSRADSASEDGHRPRPRRRDDNN